MSCIGSTPWVVNLLGVASSAFVAAIAISLVLGRPGVAAVFTSAAGVLLAVAYLAKVLLTAGDSSLPPGDSPLPTVPGNEQEDAAP
jgi:hypothetical protein